ncbi:unnamed protein product, partial [Rotaria sordida]
ILKKNKGNETKIIKSSRQTICKHALIERYINRDVLFSSLILTSLCLISAGLSIYWDRSFGHRWIYIPFILDNPAAKHPLTIVFEDNGWVGIFETQ